MTIKLLEEAIDVLATYLKANIVAKVADLRTRYSDASMPDIKTWYLGNLPKSTPEQPSIVIQGAEWRPGMQKPTNIQVTNRINLWVFVGEVDDELRFRRLCRYQIGLIELCNAGQLSFGYIFHVGDMVALTETMQTPDYLQSIMISIMLEKMEMY